MDLINKLLKAGLVTYQKSNKIITELFDTCTYSSCSSLFSNDSDFLYFSESNIIVGEFS